jgi:hypothetical protein
MSKFGVVIVLILAVAIVVAAGFYFLSPKGGGPISPSNASGTASSGSSPSLVLTSPSGTATTSGNSVSDGTITFTVPDNFGLAVSPQQILVRSYIPPCDPDFTYCLYYNGTAYKGTNFDSAGIRIERRTDLTSSSTCMNTPPTGYANFTPTSTTAADYLTSEFTPLGNAGAGHYAVGTLYRLWYEGNDRCYEFETRIGQSQFANYPSGTIQKFTSADQSSLQSAMQNFLNGITLPNDETVSFPAP